MLVIKLLIEAIAILFTVFGSLIFIKLCAHSKSKTKMSGKDVVKEIILFVAIFIISCGFSITSIHKHPQMHGNLFNQPSTKVVHHKTSRH